MITWILSVLLLGDISQGGAVAAGSVSPAVTPTPQVQQPDKEEDEVYFSDDEEGYVDQDFSEEQDEGVPDDSDEASDG